MKHSVALSALAALAQAAVPAFTNSNYNLQVGQPFVLTFSGCETACTVKLKRGDAGDLKDAATLSSNVTGNSLTVTPSQDWVPAPVAFEISNKDGVNYSPQVSPAGLGASQRSPASASGVPPAHTRIASTTVDLDDAKETDADSSEITAAPTVTPGRLTNSSSPATTMTTRGSNSTTTRSSSRTSSTSAPTSIPSSGVDRVSASLALVAGVAAALAYLN